MMRKPSDKQNRVNTSVLPWQNSNVNKVNDIPQKIRDFCSKLVVKAVNAFQEGYFSMRLILLVAGMVCLVMSITSTQEHYYGVINLIEAIMAFLILAIIFTPYGRTNYIYLGHLYVIFLDLLNIVPVIDSQFQDKFSYQYLIFFFVSSLFFREKRSLMLCIAINCIALAAISVLPAQSSSSIQDFYYSCFACVFSLTLLMLHRFNMEQRLVDSEKRYRLITENSADIICTHTSAGDLEFASPSLLSLTGYDHNDLKEISILSLIHPDDVRRIKSEVEVSESFPLDKFYQYRLRKKNGDFVWLETSIKLLSGEDSTDSAAYLTQTRSFQKNHQYLEEIERKNAELKTSYNDMEMFAYIASHDMQEPLRMISSYLQLLRKRHVKSSENESIEFIDYALKGASNLQALTRDLLAYSTLNKKGLKVVEVDIQEMVQDLINDLAILLSERNAMIRINGPLPVINCDKNAIRQLLQNLLQNAIKYNNSERPLVTVSFTKTPSLNIFKIEDNGIGIDMQYSQTIFEPFKRLHTKNQFAGTGLGLSICKRIVDRHNGNIWVESQTGIGSTFFFTIPENQRQTLLENNVD